MRKTMAVLTLKVLNAQGQTIGVSRGEDEVTLVISAEYQEGDRIVLETEAVNHYHFLQLDDALGESMVLVTGNVDYHIPFGEKRISYSPKCFMGGKHYLHARIADEKEITAYRNLAYNVNDAHGDTHMFPHATANVETRGEAVFAARNAIDGVVENRSHGEWPYESWGINMQDDAEMTIDFGHTVETEKIVLYTRSDFPHDNWWEQVTFEFSDGSSLDFKMEKSQKPHVCTFEKKQITWVKIGRLLKADDPSPFPALSQFQVWGNVVL